MNDLKKALDEQIQHKENIKKLSFKEPAKTHDGMSAIDRRIDLVPNSK